MVHTSLILPKILYFIFFMMAGSYTPFLNAFMISSGLTAAQAGFITGVRNIFFLFGMLCNVLIDHTGYCKLIMTLQLFFTAATYTPLPFYSQLVCPSATNITLAIKSNLTVNQLDDECVENKLYFIFMFVIFAASMFDFAFLSSLDSLVVQYVKESHQPDAYGEQRLFGAVGYSISTFFLPLMMEHVAVYPFPKYGIPFLNILLMAIILYPFLIIVLKKVDVNKKEKNLKKYNMKDVFGIILKDYKIAMFLFVVFINGIGISLSDNFLYVYMIDQVTDSDTIAGIAITVPVIAEFFIFALSTYILRFLKYPEYGIIIGSTSFLIRYLIMALSKTTGLIVFIQSFHALGFSLNWICTVEILRRFAPDEGITSLLTLVTILQQGAASLLANILGGYIYSHFGGRMLFFYSSFLLILPGIYLTFEMICTRRNGYHQIDGDSLTIQDHDDTNEAVL